ncbi:hypothetical protein JOQ06_018451 [Pogonophryne albipinna]|uniref:Uncharacterized protein n=1 Tax=Pogonophryne albipinna TaxID=1090488 RepID=A0AAD6AJB0_9TELE|nr:hypothetical protein JOQ06_018451 [Pogonophryne albipinna]
MDGGQYKLCGDQRIPNQGEQSRRRGRGRTFILQDTIGGSCPREVSVSSQTSENQRGTPGAAGGRDPGSSPGVAYLSPPDPARTTEEEECEGESSDSELESLIKQITIKQ